MVGAVGSIGDDEPSGRPTWYRRRPLAWQSRGFRRLAIAWVFTNIADSALYLSAAVWVKELTGSDAAAALVFVALGLPAVLAPFLGALADRYSRRRLLVGANAAVAATVVSLVFVDSPARLWLIYAVIFAYGSVGYLTAAAQSGVIRDLLPDEHLASGNGVLSTIDQSLRLVSPLIGTGLYVLAGPAAVVALTAVCFLVAAGVLAGLRFDESGTNRAEREKSYGHELSAGFRHLARTPPLGRSTLLLAAAIGATGLVNVTVFPVLEQGLAAPPSALGVVVTVQGLGAVTGGMTAAWAIRRLDELRVFATGIVVMGIGIAPLLGSSLAAILIGSACIGFGVTWTVVAFVTARQRLTPPHLQGRTSAATNVSINLPQTMLTLVGAGLLAIVDYRLLLAATVIAVLACAVVAFVTARSTTTPR